MSGKYVRWKNAIAYLWCTSGWKTFEMREFGSLYYKNTIYVNFETDERIGKYFETDIHADHVIAVLENTIR